MPLLGQSVTTTIHALRAHNGRSCIASGVTHCGERAVDAITDERIFVLTTRNPTAPRRERRSPGSPPRKDLAPMATTLHKTILASAMITTGLFSSAGMALAGTSNTDNGIDASQPTHHDDGPTAQKGLVNSSDFAPNTTGDLCNNDVPVNVLGVQVPVQDLAGSIPILSSADHGNSATNAKSCSNGIAAANQ
jgi:hypothetical protein